LSHCTIILKILDWQRHEKQPFQEVYNYKPFEKIFGKPVQLLIDAKILSLWFWPIVKTTWTKKGFSNKDASSENGVWTREIFSLVWLSIELLFYIEILLYVYNSRHPKQEAFWRDSSPSTYIVRWWQHHQTKLVMSRMFTNTVHAVSPPDIWSQCCKCRH
jgi:hypothetical protein